MYIHAVIKQAINSFAYDMQRTMLWKKVMHYSDVWIWIKNWGVLSMFKTYKIRKHSQFKPPPTSFVIRRLPLQSFIMSNDNPQLYLYLPKRLSLNDGKWKKWSWIQIRFSRKLQTIFSMSRVLPSQKLHCHHLFAHNKTVSSLQQYICEYVQDPKATRNNTASWTFTHNFLNNHI